MYLARLKSRSLNISSEEYYVDVIAENLGVADAHHVLLSRKIDKFSSEMIFCFSLLELPVESDSTVEDLSYEANSQFKGNPIFLVKIFMETWICKDLFHAHVTPGTCYRMLVGSLPNGGYKLSRHAIIAADLCTSLLVRTREVSILGIFYLHFAVCIAS